MDAELMRLTRLRSAHAEEQFRIRSNLRHARDEAESSAARLVNLKQDITKREDTSGENFRLKLDGEIIVNRGIAGELLIRRAEKLRHATGDDVRVGRFAGFDLFLRVGFAGDADLVVRGKNSYSARVTDTALGTIRSLESTVQGFEERAEKLESTIADDLKRAKELEQKIGAPFDREERYQDLIRRQSEIEDSLDLTKNQASNQLPAIEGIENSSVSETPKEQVRAQKQSVRNGIRV